MAAVISAVFEVVAQLGHLLPVFQRLGEGFLDFPGEQFYGLEQVDFADGRGNLLGEDLHGVQVALSQNRLFVLVVDAEQPHRASIHHDGADDETA